MCMRLERTLGRNLMYLACRHHILELVLQAAFTSLVGDVSQGPNITTFSAFREYWPHVDQSKFSTALDDEKMSGVVAPWG